MNETLKKHLRIIGFLLGSGLLGVGLTYLAKLPKEYGLVLAPVINYLLYIIELELKNEGFIHRKEIKE